MSPSPFADEKFRGKILPFCTACSKDDRVAIEEEVKPQTHTKVATQLPKNEQTREAISRVHMAVNELHGRYCS